MAYHDATQPWYADDDSALCKFDRIGLYFNSVKHFSPVCRYHPNSSKSVIVVLPDNLSAGKESGLHHGFKVCTGASYMCGFIEDEKSKREWLKYWTSE